MSLRRWLRWRRDEELDEEIDTHLELEIRANVDRGLTAEQARTAALRTFGNRTQLKEKTREANPFFNMQTFVRDVLFGLRMIRRSPGFAAAATVSLALGIGANTLIFSVVDSTLLKPLPFPNSDRLVILWNIADQSRPDVLGTSSIPRYYAFRDKARSFESVGAFNGFACGSRNLGFDEYGVPSERILGQTLSPSMFRTLGVTPVMGRTFTDEEDRADNIAPVMLISHRTWQRRFGGKANVLGKTLTLNHVPTTVIGVLPADFDFFGDNLEFFAPLCLTRAQELSRIGGNTVVARLKPGVSIEKAQAEVRHIGTACRKRSCPSPGDRHAGRAAPTRHCAELQQQRPAIWRLRLTTSDPAGRGGVRAAHRLRQRGRPAAGPYGKSPRRNRAAPCAGRQPVARDSSDDDREPPDCCIGWDPGRGPFVGGASTLPDDGAAWISASRSHCARWSSAGVYGSGRSLDDRALCGDTGCAGQQGAASRSVDGIGQKRRHGRGRSSTRA
jgi:hypothetical protein